MGDPVIFIPPMLSDARVFAHQFAELSRDHIVVFAPLIVGSTIADYAADILRWAPPEFAVAGQGMGGNVALEMVQRAPKRITRIALINTNARADTPKTAADREPRIIAAKAGRFHSALDEEWTQDHFCENTDLEVLVPKLLDMANGLGPDIYVQQSRALQKRKDQQAILRKIQQPALVVSGDCDIENTLRRQEFVAEMIPYAKHEIVTGAGLLPSLEQPKQVSDILRDWCRQPLILR